MNRSIWSAVALLLLLCAARANALEPQRQGQEAFIANAVWAQGKLWVLSDAGDLSTIAEGASHRERESLPQPVFGLCALQGDPIALIADRRGEGDWTLMRRRPDGWRLVRTIRTDGSRVRNIDCDADGILIVSYRRLVELRPDGAMAKETTLGGALGGRGVVTTALRTADSIYVGIDAGEWGGGLRRIDRRTGAVTSVERLDTGDGICGGMLNASCDPVNGLEHEPGKSDCVVAAIGLLHFMASGRLIEVCRDRVELFYSKPFHGWSLDNPKGKATETVAFFGLTRAGDHLLATGIDGLYEVRAGGKVAYAQLPAFHLVDGVAVSFARPDVALVLTEINERVSVSGAVPLVVSR